MATIKAYTDIPQSRTLSKILRIESADMYYQYVLPKSGRIKHNPEIGDPINALKWYNEGYTTSGKEPITLDEYCIPCWSLSALLGVLPNYMDGDTIRYPHLMRVKDNNYMVLYSALKYSRIYDNQVDACYEMILKLHELNLL